MYREEGIFLKTLDNHYWNRFIFHPKLGVIHYKCFYSHSGKHFFANVTDAHRPVNLTFLLNCSHQIESGTPEACWLC